MPNKKIFLNKNVAGVFRAYATKLKCLYSPICYKVAHRCTQANGATVSGTVLFITPVTIGQLIIAMNVSVCVFVCPRYIFGTTRLIFTKFFMHVTYGRGSVLLWRRNDMLRIFVFMDDAIFAHRLMLDVASRLIQ